MSILNTIKNLFSNKDTTEGSSEPKKLLELSMSDEELVKEIDNDVRSSKPLYDKIKQIQDENEAYYLGEQLDRKRFDYELPTAENLLYMATETIMAIIASQRREPIVLPGTDTDESKELAEKTQTWLSWKWSDEDMVIKFEEWIRSAMIAKIGVIKVRYDQFKDDFEIKGLKSQRIMIDKDATDEDNAKFIIEFKEDTMADLIATYPKAKEKLTQLYGKEQGTTIKYLEYWTNEFVVWKVGSIVLDKKKNPNWNWDEKAGEKTGKLKEKWANKVKNEKLQNVLLNYFDKPQKPYIILSLKSLGNSIYADTTDFEQGKVIQDIINRRKRLIDKAANKALGREVVSGSFISKEEAKKMLANPNAPLWLKSGKAQDAITYVAPSPISPVLFSDLQESQQALDNVMGTHGTTRGERGSQETLGGRNILRQGDYGRIDLTVKRINKKLELLYGWMMQMAKVYYTEDHYAKMMGKEGAIEYLKFSGDAIEDGQEIRIKSELTVDKSSEREAITGQMQAGLLDPLSYFEAMDVDKPKEKARKVILYTLDPKLYLSEYLVDANTPGADRDPARKAEQENQALDNGEQVPPFAQATPDHIQIHAKRMQSDTFNGLSDEIKMAYMTHVKAEIDILKQGQQAMGGTTTSQPSPVMQPPPIQEQPQPMPPQPMM